MLALIAFLADGQKRNMCIEYEEEKEAKRRYDSIRNYRSTHKLQEVFDIYRVDKQVVIVKAKKKTRGGRSMTNNQQARAITKACIEAGLDSHITWHNCAADAHTWAEKISVRFRDGRQPRPVKNSYMFCDTLDMCFFYGGPQHDIPYMTYAGYVTAGSPDITEDKLMRRSKRPERCSAL